MLEQVSHGDVDAVVAADLRDEVAHNVAMKALVTPPARCHVNRLLLISPSPPW